MKTIAIINQKGGTGKTTTSVNLAAALARTGADTLLVDLDPQAHATIGVGLDPEDFDGKTVGEALLLETPDLSPFITGTYLKHLKLVPASLRLSKTASLLHSRNFREQHLAQALASVKGFDYMLIDCQPTLEVLPINAMVAANCFIIPTPPSGYGIRGLTDLLETLRTIKRQDTRSYDWRVLRTMYMPQARGTNALVEQVLDSVRANVLKTIIHRNERLNRAQTEDQPRDIFAFDKGSRGAKDYEALAKEIRALW